MHVSPPRRSTVLRAFILLPGLLCISCSRGPSLNPVHGQLLFKHQPVAGALLTFHPKDADIKTILPVGLTDEEGRYTLETGEGEGAPAGDYVVTIIAPQQVATGKKTISLGNKPDSVDRFKGAYVRKDASTFRFEIKSGNNELAPIDLN
jgi:hypothetical protein